MLPGNINEILKKDFYFARRLKFSNNDRSITGVEFIIIKNIKKIDISVCVNCRMYYNTKITIGCFK